MAINRKAVLVGLLLCAAGAWLLFRPSDGGETTSAESGPDAELSSEHVDDPDAIEPPSAASGEDGGSGGEAASGDTNAAPLADGEVAMGAELESLSLERLPTPTTIQVDTSCDRGYAGLGVELRAWGDVLVPYTPGYPTSEPGELWNCTADTVFGGAIAMTHAAYLEALRPDLIPAIALDTPGRDLRINDHPGENPSALLGFSCSPIGWNWDGENTWSLLHRCGDGDLQVSFFPMEYRDGRWWLVYPRNGDIETGPPPADYEYYAFLGGD